MDIGILAFMLFGGWFVLSMIAPNDFELEGNQKKSDMWLGIIVAWVLGFTLLILFVAGVFG
jgi:hypothetical protein